MKRQIIIWLVACLLFGCNSYAQNQANIWYFGYKHGLDFNSGYAEYLDDCPEWQYYTTSISDTNGNLLFFTDGQTVWNKEREIMINGEGLHGDRYNPQPAVICPDPGNADRYYVFTVGSPDIHKGLEYNIIGMALDNGNGSVVTKNVVVPAGEFAKHKITAVKKANNVDYWIITRFDDPNNPNVWACFSLTATGLDPIPVISPARYSVNAWMQHGAVKVSHDQKKIISVQSGDAGSHGRFDVCNFDIITGEIDHRFYIKEHNSNPDGFGIYGMEITPDSKLLYISFYAFHQAPLSYLSFVYQYDLTRTDSLGFLNSRLVVSTDSRASSLQLGPDGKIYVSTISSDPFNSRYLGVIHNVWERGIFCNYEKNAVDIGVYNGHSGSTLPSFPSELLYRFVWQGGPCAKTPFTFRHRFIPEPDSIVWNFGDGTTSTDFNPTHVFQAGGNYEVHAHVVYPDGRIEETSREVEVLAVPEPQMPDTLMLCTGESGQLDAGSGFTQYLWMGQFTPGNQYYPVTDTGTYTV
ncbi:MAG: PKD domain-containing protein, partial [Lentimicrobiaceae bacterium]|nr:PKD domain-containing protein [Lentimicrobiaceae bacterium]